MSDVDMFESEENNAENHENLEDSATVPDTPMDTSEKEEAKEEGKVIIDKEDDFSHRIQLTKIGSFNEHKPYVYHDLEEILRYTIDCFPKNNKIHLIGVHIFCSHKGHFLQKCSDNKVSIPLDFTVAESVPDKNETVSVFGFLEIKNSLPMFFVKFFRKEAKPDVNRYINVLLKIRKYVPRDFITTVSIDTI